MRRIYRMWLLWRLVRRMEQECDFQHGASFTILVEPETRWVERCRVAKANNEPPPEREQAWEVTYWHNVGASSMTRKGWTMEEALKRALDLESQGTLRMAP